MSKMFARILMINRYPKLTKALISIEALLLVFILYGVVMRPALGQDATHIAVLEQKVIDSSITTQQNTRDIAQMRADVSTKETQNEGRLAHVETMLDWNNKLLSGLAIAVMMQIIETFASYVKAAAPMRRRDD